jgi:GTP-binding protein
MERLGQRKGQLRNMEPDGKGRARLEYLIPARGLIGFQTEFRTITAGTGLLFHVFDHFGPRAEGAIAERQNGVLISNGTGPSPAYAQIAMQERGRLLVEPGEEIYEGQIVGIHSKDNDLTVNALRGKQLTNFRASGKDDDEGLIPPIKMSLEQALEFIADDELVEVTPNAIRLRKKERTEVDRKRASRSA